MLISPPRLRNQNSGESDADWVERMIPIDVQRNFPINASQAWHGGVHLMHSDVGNNVEYIRAIADGTVISLRQPDQQKRDIAPLNYNGSTDFGYVLLKHETEIGSGERGKVQYYSLYMHMGSIKSEVKQGAKVYRKDPLGQVGHIDGQNGIHFQIFCDDDNLEKLVGRKTMELDTGKDGRTDIVYGDMHFYLPTGTKFYPAIPVNDGVTPTESTEPLYVTMRFEQGSCRMTTRKKASVPNNGYVEVGEVLIDVDYEQYEYNLYKRAKELYPDSPGAGYALLRFGRVLNTERETLVPSNAPLWRTVNYPGGRGVVNLAASEIKKFSDGDFPHWTGWILIDDDEDNNSQWNSPALFARNGEDLSRTICHFPLEWNEATAEDRYRWLKSPTTSISLAKHQTDLLGKDRVGNKQEASYTQTELQEFDQSTPSTYELVGETFDQPTPSAYELAGETIALADKDWDELMAHIKALCFKTEALGLPSGRVWHFEPRQFISHFRKCLWLSKAEFKQTIPLHTMRKQGRIFVWENVDVNEGANSIFSRHYPQLNIAMRKYCINTPLRMACFLGNAIQETQWMAKTEEGYRYKRFNERTRTDEYYNIWYYPWYGRGFLQLTNPINYFSYFTFRGRQYPQAVRNALVTAYNRLAAGNEALRRDDTTLYDVNHRDLTAEVIGWRDELQSGVFEPADSAGFYWCQSGMAKYADKNHVLERQVIATNRGNNVYYRSPAFWQASATVNLPSRVDREDYSGLNGFDARCCAYGNAIAILTEMKFPDADNHFTSEKPESNQLRRS